MVWAWNPGSIQALTCAFLLTFPTLLPAQTQLLLCGGGQEPVSAMEELVQRAGGPQATLLFIGFAASYPEKTAARFQENIEQLTDGNATVMNSPFLSPAFDAGGERLLNEDNEPQFVEELSNAQQIELASQLEKATGIWLSGGIQDRFMRIMERYPELKKNLIKQFKAGKIVGGSSAGAAVAAEIMVTGSKKKNTFWQMPGMGFIGALIDQHLFVRNRVDRFRASMREYQTKVRWGMGIDEDAAVLITGGRSLTVMEGGNDVLIIDPRDLSGGTMKEVRLKPGEHFELTI